MTEEEKRRRFQLLLEEAAGEMRNQPPPQKSSGRVDDVQTFSEGAQKFRRSVVEEEGPKAKRFGNRLLTSAPAAAEDLAVSFMDPVKTGKSVGDWVGDKAETAMSPGGLKKLQREAKDSVGNALSSPEALADMVVNILLMKGAKKLPVLRDIKGDDAAVAAEMAKDTLGVVTDAHTQAPPPLGSKLSTAWKEMNEGNDTYQAGVAGAKLVKGKVEEGLAARARKEEEIARALQDKARETTRRVASYATGKTLGFLERFGIK